MKRISISARLSGTMACVALLLFLIVSTSPEFANFSLVLIDPIMPSVGALVLSLIAAVLTHGMSAIYRFVLLGLYVVGPPIGYGVFLTSLWVAWGGWELIDVFLLVAGQRVFAQMITTGALSAVGLLLALVATSYLFT